jgi:hypothetical protein
MRKAKSNRLSVLAADIRAAHEDVGRSSKQTAERAVEAGRLLAEAKGSDDIPRGGWQRWVENVAGVPYQTAQRYCQLFVAVSDGSILVEDIAEAGQKGALKAASELTDEAEPENAPEDELNDPDELASPSQSELDRIADAEAGRCVVANMHDGEDDTLVAWARAHDRFVRIDRKTEWGNPFAMPDDGERAEVIGKFTKFYLPYKDGLLSRIPSLRGKVLGCWCHPEECHGHIIAEIVNREADGEATAERLADEIAEVDG